ncbi:restriction endonuclease subunit S [Allobaculum sp. Allo2]|uniref:restriction endonuclease subunit S n=1 Tax=Allobaculum sp. Allo2 TaxID=2853432 RepID=UPI001F606D7A|nr:restriction endonuclease subunit S [Allobaculum sp. Allo2]UNT94290.1 restriction endonuclease subunit S [Allobaculum sp. Allo2]
MKSNWKTVKLQELGRVVGGATPSTKNEAFYGGSIPWLTPKDLADYSERYISKGERSITEEGLNSCSTELLPAGTVLFSSRAPIGYVAIASNPICTNQGFKSVVPDTGVVDPLFLYYLLVFNKEKIKSAGSGTTFKEVSGNVMKNIEVEIPTSVDYQRKIAQILGSIDNQIESNARINKNLLDLIDTVFKQKSLKIHQ